MKIIRIKKSVQAILLVVVFIFSIPLFSINTIAAANSVIKNSAYSTNASNNFQLNLYNHDYSEIKLQWQPIKGATSTSVWFSTQKNKGYKGYKNLSGKLSEYVITKLIPDKTYYFKVKIIKNGKTYTSAVNSLKASDASDFDIINSKAAFTTKLTENIEKELKEFSLYAKNESVIIDKAEIMKSLNYITSFNENKQKKYNGIVRITYNIEISNSKAVLYHVNKARTENGLSPLSYNSDMDRAAELRAKELIQLFSHTRPDETSCFSVLQDFEIEYQGAGENIAYGYYSAKAVFEGWMNSPGHRANILTDDFTHMGLGRYENHWAQLFITETKNTYLF